jgi:hypothetical protein
MQMKAKEMNRIAEATRRRVISSPVPEKGTAAYADYLNALIT